MNCYGCGCISTSDADPYPVSKENTKLEHFNAAVTVCTAMCTAFQEKCAQYWPSERSARYQYFVVDPLAEYNMPQYILREFKVSTT